ncbi:hypothetical protein BT96DRAFT_1004544 [Gymnopus androsaceus JB14]|uniref:Uncharacterized protein n=1 Tax=Gymnopus androsaceus JB14 TaxID=1447944 RepID=A0A6A4GQX0_9AGAR|nr:hypothetical protein BT96DRAFT_1004544 [Gymnopus androsaceus JB14]
MACKPCDYPIQIHCLIALALAIFHNYFRIYKPNRNSSNLSMPPVRDTVAGLETMVNNNSAAETHFPTPANLSEDDRAAVQRNAIAEAMWVQYQEELQRPSMLVPHVNQHYYH